MLYNKVDDNRRQGGPRRIVRLRLPHIQCPFSNWSAFCELPPDFAPPWPLLGGDVRRRDHLRGVRPTRRAVPGSGRGDTGGTGMYGKDSKKEVLC